MVNSSCQCFIMPRTAAVLLTFVSATWITVVAITPSFVKEPVDTEVQFGDSTDIFCQINSLAELCQWRLLQDDSIRHRKMLDFIPPENHGNDCSFHIRFVEEDHQGLWECAVWPLNQGDILVSRRARLTVTTHNVSSRYEISISNTQNGTESEESDHESTTLPSPTAPTAMVSRRHGPRFLHRPQTMERATGSLARLVCRLNQPLVSCLWLHPTGSAILVPSVNSKYHTKLDSTGKECSLEFTVDLLDQGTWQCLVRPHGSKTDLVTEITTINVHPIWSRQTASPELEQQTFILFGVLGAILLVVVILLLFITQWKQESAMKYLAVDSVQTTKEEPYVKSTGVATLKKESGRPVMSTIPAHVSISKSLHRTTLEHCRKCFMENNHGHVYENKVYDLEVKQDPLSSVGVEEESFSDNHKYDTVDTPSSQNMCGVHRDGTHYVVPNNVYLPIHKQSEHNNPTPL